MHSKYFAIVDPQSTDIIGDDGIRMGCCLNLQEKRYRKKHSNYFNEQT